MRVEVCVGVLECAFRYYSCTLVVQVQKNSCPVEDRIVGSAVCTCGDDECLAGGVDVGLRPWQHPNARELKEMSELVGIW